MHSYDTITFYLSAVKKSINQVMDQFRGCMPIRNRGWAVHPERFRVASFVC